MKILSSGEDKPELIRATCWRAVYIWCMDHLDRRQQQVLVERRCGGGTDRMDESEHNVPDGSVHGRVRRIE